MPHVSWECIEVLQKIIECYNRCDEKEYDRLADLVFHLCQPQPEPEPQCEEL